MDTQFILSLITAIFIGGVSGYLGSLMVSKRMALVGGALGHLTLPGIALALIYGFDVSLGALPFVILGIILIWLFEIRTKLPMEALTAVVFASGVAIAFLVLPSEKTVTALIGNISQIGIGGGIISVILALAVFLIIKKIFPKVILSGISEDLAKVEGIDVKKYNFIFLASIAIVVALGVKIVGGLLTAALLAIPACAARNVSRNLFQYSYGGLIIGIFSCIFGILLFKLTGLPAGPLIILTSALIFIFSMVFKK
jgi:ABC-type Mn2+/Zn2+ transport system permease subunit